MAGEKELNVGLCSTPACVAFSDTPDQKFCKHDIDLKLLNHLIHRWRCCQFFIHPITVYWEEKTAWALDSLLPSAKKPDETAHFQLPDGPSGDRQPSKGLRKDWGMNLTWTCFFKPQESLWMAYCISSNYILLDLAHLCASPYFVNAYI